MGVSEGDVVRDGVELGEPSDGVGVKLGVRVGVDVPPVVGVAEAIVGVLVAPSVDGCAVGEPGLSAGRDVGL